MEKPLTTTLDRHATPTTPALQHPVHTSPSAGTLLIPLSTSHRWNLALSIRAGLKAKTAAQ